MSRFAVVLRMRQLKKGMLLQLHAGLAMSGDSSLLMLPTMVDILPNGCVNISFVALFLTHTGLLQHLGTKCL